ncbi:formylglycine-generating enzyme family protein [Maribacter aurantiacus]|uniref:Formylglycine-generating enzyme family protein n=1 Tax=Maribacter aurantiacus TaxID=1882343 RepID=A0A5R8M8E7_9FLAO|nr:formylglycine-generating enzyme family protein [Maribacter aurantiacus]TLF45842.1 formylglycine-generating enzyme family protein [Maribacter aurantiacus]
MHLIDRLPLFLFILMGLTSAFSQNENLKDFTQNIGGSKLNIEMIAIPSGSFNMGSPTSENHRNLDEGPVHEVTLNSFWISKYEITWEVYNLFVNRAIDDSENPVTNRDIDIDIDAISGATIPYVDMSLGMGTSEGLPVGNVTRYAATQFCKWLSAKTGHFYRLPTEAEWEYCARAGTSTAYHFGDDPKILDDFAWFYANSEDTYHQVGQKSPNPWGLFDMYGNVAEWTLDQYIPDAYKERKNSTVSPFEIAKKTYPISVRGGSYNDDAEYLRSAARLGSNENWKMRDPQFPKSKWWNTDAPFVGFRIVRDPKVPNENEINHYWGQ